MSTPIQRWRCPVALQAKSVVLAAAGMAVAKVFFPLWFAVPVMVALGIWGLGMCVRRGGVIVDPGAGVVVVRLGFLTRRVGLANISAIQVDRSKVTIARSDGAEISVYVWRKSRLDGWLRIPVAAGDVAHAISAAAQAASPEPAADGGTARAGAARRPLALILLGCTGLVALAAAFLVRVSWGSPVMTAFGVVLALALGVSGVFYVLFALWLLLAGRATRMSRDQARTA